MFARLALTIMTLLLAQSAPAATVCNAQWADAARGRSLPLRIHLPAGTRPVAAIIWTPGLGATSGGGAVWARAWSAAGFAVITVQHPGSDNAAYAPGTPAEQQARVRHATSPTHLMERADDISFILDELARRPAEGQCNLARIDRSRIGVAGHSLGAWTVQGLAGQRLDGERALIDRRPRAFVGLSGSQLQPGDPAAAFGQIGRPYLVISGTRDGGPPETEIVARRTAIWRGLPADGRKYLALFDSATHMMFAGNRAATDPLGQRVEAGVIRLTTAFWRRWLLENPRADAVLANPRLPTQDRWERK